MSWHNVAKMAAILALVPAADMAGQAPVTMRVTTRLVELHVVVQDSHGNPVTDLKRADFEIFDNGKQQEIKVFQLDEYPAAAPALAAGKPAETPAMAQGDYAFSNRTPVDTNAPNAPTVVLIDGGNTWDSTRMTWQDLVYARAQLIKFLGQLHPEDRLGVYFMGQQRFWVLREYTQNCADMLERLAAWKETAAPARDSAKYPDVWTEFAVRVAGVDRDTAMAIHRAQFWSTDAKGSAAVPGSDSAPRIHTGSSEEAGAAEIPAAHAGAAAHAATPSFDATFLPPGNTHPLAILEAVANHLAALPGRKNLILISGATFLPTTYKERLDALRPIIQSGLSVYTVDPGGLAPYNADASFAIPSLVTMNAPNGLRAVAGYINQHYNATEAIHVALQLSLTELAEATGGQVFVDTNNIKGAIQKSFDDSRTTYTLGFYPKDSNNRGSFHPVKVKVTSPKHVALRYRTGYFAPEEPSRDAGLRKVELERAVWSPLDASTIQLNASVARAAAGAYELGLNIGLAAVSMQPENGRWDGQIEVALVERDNSGNEYGPAPQTLGLALRQESHDQALKSGLPYRRTFKLDPKATSLRVVVRDLNSDSVGTLTIPVL